MADEQPGRINKDVRDVTTVPQAEDLVRNNVGSTVRDNSNFKVVSEAEAAVASTLYLDPSIQAAHTSPNKTQNASGRATATPGRDIERTTGEEAARGVGINGSEIRPAGQVAEATNVVREGPVVVMSDANNY
ncbi:unnamed protein product, partial [Laminaria digitata]